MYMIYPDIRIHKFSYNIMKIYICILRIGLKHNKIRLKIYAYTIYIYIFH